MEFDYAGPGLGKGGHVTLYLDGVKIGEGEVAATAAMISSADDTCDVGRENGALVAEDYPSGVTGHFDHRNVDDVRCGIALSMRSRRRTGGCLRTAERRRFQAFAARLLPEATSRATKSTPSGKRGQPTATVLACFGYFRAQPVCR
jgi:hypothetical protein